MKLWKFTPLIVSILCCTQPIMAQSTYKENVERYINTYKDLAIEEQQRSGIPAAITLAQGVHETNAGMSELATNANNHFGIKCKKSWTGATYSYTDDAPNECFRKYDKALDSYKDHTDYLKNAPRYNSLFELSITDYAAWAAGLKRCGYATNPKYAQMLIKLIEQYHLQDYTYAAMDDNKNPLKTEKKTEPVLAKAQPSEVIPAEDAPALPTKERKSGMVVDENNGDALVIKNNAKPAFGQLVRVNGLKAFYAKKGTSLLGEAVKFNIRYAKLLEINDLTDAPLEADMFIYTEKKHSKGNTALHVVKPGETLLQAAQYEGMQLKYLKYYNKLANNEQPAAGALLYLQDMADEKPELLKEENNTVKVVDVSGRFAGDSPGAIPQGSTRMKAGYISKKEIEKAGKDKTIETTKPVVEKLTTTKSEPITTPQTEKHLASDAMASVDEKKAAEEAAAAKIKADEETKIAEAQQNVIALKQPTEVATTKPTTTAELQPTVTAETKPTTTTELQPTVTAATKPENEEAPKQPTEVAATKPTTTAELQPTVTAETKPIDSVAPTAPKTETPVAPAQEPVAVAVAAPPPPPEPEQPKDEFDILKAKLDRVVYAESAATTKAKETKTAKTTTPEAKAETPTQKELKPQPKPTPGSTKAQAGFVGLYTVKKGDTGFSIAKKNNITMSQLMEWNNLTDFKEVKVGQQLRVK